MIASSSEDDETCTSYKGVPLILGHPHVLPHVLPLVEVLVEAVHPEVRRVVRMGLSEDLSVVIEGYQTEL